jgi:hypothetical protein
VTTIKAAEIPTFCFTIISENSTKSRQKQLLEGERAVTFWAKIDNNLKIILSSCDTLASNY